jgi:hypothetical protein
MSKIRGQDEPLVVEIQGNPVEAPSWVQDCSGLQNVEDWAHKQFTIVIRILAS